MNEEEIIRKEAKEFFDITLDRSRKVNAIDDFHDIKTRIYDFYSSESKAIFLDELKTQIVITLQNHRNQSHEGNPGVNCRYEVKPEKLLFYIKQEIETLPTVAYQKNESNPSQERNNVFVSYSHFDREYLNDLQRHFKPYLSRIGYWDDTKILPGQKWRNEIKKAIESTKIAILLVSTDFLGSDFIATDELPPLLKAAEENGAVILIVILKPCLFEEFNTLNQYQTMNPPNKPISKMNYNEREELFVNLVRQTKRILKGDSFN